MSRRALVTGSEGFAGRILCRRLVDGGWDVIGADVTAPEDASDRRRCDLTDPQQAGELVERAGPVTHVFHLAGLTFVPQAMEDPVRAMRVNYGGTVHLLRAVRMFQPQARVLHVSTSEVYGPPGYLPVDEEHPINPVNPYSISKAAADHYARFLAGDGEMDLVLARPFNHSGPGQSPAFVLSSLARQVAEIEAGRAEPVLRVGNLAAARDFSHVDDVARAYELLVLKGRRGEVYNICSGRSHTIQEAMEGLIALTGRAIRWEIDPARWRPEADPEIRGCHAKLTADTGWRPEVDFPTLLADVLDDWRARVRSPKA
jgi:GDP-4-dehydro-6-deoxy-D-mannose reductase